ncbi:MAG: hypothetical protein AVDCRST_MAG03-493, partial [uncultured Rubrobacteraceae bacterium]
GDPDRRARAEAHRGDRGRGQHLPRRGEQPAQDPSHGRGRPEQHLRDGRPAPGRNLRGGLRGRLPPARQPTRRGGDAGTRAHRSGPHGRGAAEGRPADPDRRRGRGKPRLRDRTPGSHADVLPRGRRLGRNARRPGAHRRGPGTLRPARSVARLGWAGWRPREPGEPLAYPQPAAHARRLAEARGRRPRRRGPRLCGGGGGGRRADGGGDGHQRPRLRARGPARGRPDRRAHGRQPPAELLRRRSGGAQERSL